MLPILNIHLIKKILSLELAVKISKDELNSQYFVPWRRCFDVRLCQMGCESQAEEITLGFKLLCLHKGCGPSATSPTAEEMKIQREVIRTTGLAVQTPSSERKQVGGLCRNPGIQDLVECL